MKRRQSITLKVTLGVVSLALILSTILVCISYFTYKNTMDEQYETRGNQIAKTAISMVDDDYMLSLIQSIEVKKYESVDEETSMEIMETEEYQNVLETFRKIRDNNDVLYLYMVYPTTQGAYFIVDTDTSEEACPYGYFMEYYEGTFYEIRNDLVKGREVPAVISDEDYGWIISIIHPYLSENNELIGYICADISMEDVVVDRENYLLNTIIIMAVITIAAAIMELILFKKNLVRPIQEMTKATETFVSRREDSTSSGSPISALDVQTNDELQILCESLKQMETDLNNHINNLNRMTAEKERIGAELDIATHIQKSMLPCIFPAFPDQKSFDIYATMTPAKEVGGDFYDFFMVDENHLAVVMADVSGKGVPAALFMVIGKTLIKDHTQPDKDLGEIFTKVNNLLCESNSEGLFITAFEGVLDLRTGDFTYVNAGHESPFICKKSENYEFKKIPAGFVLAGFEGFKYKAGYAKLEPGDKFFQYTDGVTEATNAQEELYGMDRLGACLNKNTNLAPDRLLPTVKADIDNFVKQAPQFDDITMLCLEFKEYKN